MKAIILKEFGSVDNLLLQDIPIPSIKDNEVLVKVKAISICPVDVMTRKGYGQANSLKNNKPMILGWGISGEVAEVGDSVLNFRVRESVFGMVNFPGCGNGYAESVAVPELQLAHRPKSVSHEEAVSASMSALTVWQAFTEYGVLRYRDEILIHGAAGGVGHYAVQIAKYMGGYVIATDSSSNKDFVLGLGADEYIDYQSQHFENLIKDIDFVLDTVGGKIFTRSLDVVKPKGTIVSMVGNIDGDAKLLAKRKGLRGSFRMGVKSNGKDLRSIAQLLEKGIVKSHVSKVFSFDEMAQAHLQIELGRTVGKIVVVL